MAIAAPINGNAVLVEIDGTVVGSQTGVTFSESRDTIDKTSKANAGTTALIKGKYSSTCSMNALYVDSDTAFTAVRAAVRSGAQVLLMRQEPQGSGGTDADVAVDWYKCTALVTSISEDFPQDGVGTCSAEFAVNGAWEAA